MAVGIQMMWVGMLLGCAGESVEPTKETATDTGSGIPSVCEAVGASVTIGAGEFSFAPLAEGDEVELVLGPQDGWHVLTGAMVTGFGPAVSVIGHLETLDGGVVASGNDTKVEVDLARPGLATWDEASCSGSFFGQFTYVDDIDPGTSSLIASVCALHNTDLRFGIDVEDAATGAVHSDMITVHARLDPDTRCP